MERSANALAELAERLASNEVRFVEGDEFPIHLSKNAIRDFRKARHIIAELAKVNHGEASPTPWRAHTDREVRANDERLWIEDVVCQTQSCPKTRYTKAEREEWNIPATANTKLIVASVNAVAECRKIAYEK